LDSPLKNVATVGAAKEKLRALKKQKEEALAAPKEKSAVQRTKIRRQIKRLKRLSRALARKAAAAKAAAQPAAPAAEAAPAAPE
jgi:hypothetical protein